MKEIKKGDIVSLEGGTFLVTWVDLETVMGTDDEVASLTLQRINDNQIENEEE